MFRSGDRDETTAGPRKSRHDGADRHVVADEGLENCAVVNDVDLAVQMRELFRLEETSDDSCTQVANVIRAGALKASKIAQKSQQTRKLSQS